MAHIFISYSRKDFEAADRLRATLAKAGYEAWIDREIPGGDLWKKRIAEAIEAARAFMVLLSPNAVASDNVRKELDMADSRKKLILPLVIAPTKIPHEMEYSLAGLQWIDVSTTSDGGERKLLSELKSLIEQDETSWSMTDTKEGRKRLSAILADPSRSIREKIEDFRVLAGEPTEAHKAWQARMDNLEDRKSANAAEKHHLFEKLQTLLNERNATLSAEILKLISEKETEVHRRLDALSSESRAQTEELMALLDEAGRERDKMMERSRKMLEESDKLIEKIWKKDA